MQNNIEMEVREAVVEVICLQLGIKELSEADRCRSLSDLNIDSFERMELVLRLEARLSVEIPDEEVTQDRLATVNDLIRYLLTLIRR